jgi:pimeloyl-ACP methyl ester carboxylesterase
MRVLRWLLIVTAVLVAGAAAIFVGGALLSWDWDRVHTARTAALPLVSESAPDGLVRIDTGDLVFRARVAGLGGRGPGVILLHGFPATSAMWTPLIDAAAAEGYRVVAFDQRGYSPGARPDGVSAYAVPNLVRDVLDVADALGFETFHLVGHDWGCVVGWSVAIEHPDRVLSWSGLSIPHPGALFESLREETPEYIRFFQTPWIPELTFTWGGLASLRDGVYTKMTEDQRDEYLGVFAEPGALTAALNWYRALGSSLDRFDETSLDVEPSVLFIWGSGEFWVDAAARKRQREFIRGPYAELEVDAGHWLIAAVEAEATE